ncbi:MAG: hypothetical protein ABT07_00420 [Microbacterium sp. SCN 70-10]|nr:MAG: hypothetical protein ABT07_00420 [Microbacterium sp. SCN 70-10]
MRLAPVLQPLVKQQLRNRIGLLRRQAGRIEADQVAAGRQAVRIADRITTIGGRHEAPVERSEQAGHLVVYREQAVQRLRPLGQRAQCFLIDPPFGRAVRYGAGALRTQVEPGGGIGVVEGHFQPAHRARFLDLPVIHQKGFIDVFTESIEQGHAQALQDQLPAQSGVRHFAEHGQAARLAGIGDLVQPGMQRIEESVEFPAHAFERPLEVVVQAVFDDQCGQPLADGIFGRPLVGNRPFVHQFVQLPHAVAEAAGGQHRRTVTEQQRPTAPFGGQRFAQVVDDVGIDHRQIAERQQCIVLHIQPACLAVGPFLRAVSAEMDQCVGPARPQVNRQIVVRQRHAALVHERVLAAMQRFFARRLRQYRNVAEL